VATALTYVPVSVFSLCNIPVVHCQTKVDMADCWLSFSSTFWLPYWPV